MKNRITVAVLCLLLTLCACAKKEKIYTVNFDTDGGSFIEAYVIDSDHKKAVRPDDPVKEGYTFTEWQLDGETYDFSKEVKKNITLKAVYQKADDGKDEKKEETEVLNHATVIIEGDKKEVTWKQGTTLQLDNPVSKDGRNFAGWIIDGTMDGLWAARDGSVIEAAFDELVIPCRSVKTEYTGYWTVEGNPPWKLDVILDPANTTDKVSYKSEDESIVTIDQDGYITVGKVGNTRINITCGEASWTIKFETRAKRVKTTGIAITPASMSLSVNESKTITATVTPENATDKTVTYTSDDPNVATVDSNGVVTGKKPGTANITVTARDGQKAVCAVTVK